MSHAAAAVLTVLPALDGESSGGSAGTGLAVISVVSIVFGYVLIFALWRFVFSAKARRRRGEKDPPA